MRSKRGDVLRWALVASLLADKGHAQRDESLTSQAKAPTFEYSSPAECPAREEFVKRVNARQSLPSTDGVHAALDALLLRVVVAPSSIEGWVHFRDARIAPRKVASSTCDEVVTGLALIVGMSLREPADRPNSTADKTPLDTFVTSDAARASAASASARELAAIPPEASIPAAVTKARPSSVPSVPRVQLGVSPRDTAPLQEYGTAVGVGAAGGLWSAFGRAQPRFDAFFELGEATGAWAARLNAFATWDNDTELSWSADWFGYGARLETCPVLGSPGWHVGFCALAEVGAVSVRGRSGVGNRVDDARLLWADAGVGVRLGSPSLWKVNLEAQLDAVVPFTRYALVFEQPAVTLAQVPAVVFVARVGFRLQPALD